MNRDSRLSLLMDRDSRLYLLLHYVLLIGLIFAIVGALELGGVAIPLWLGVVVAVVVGLVYPRIVVALGIAPGAWS